MADEGTNKARRLPLYEGQEEVKIRTWVQLVRTFSLIQRRVASALTRHGLTLPQFDVMATLRFSEGVTQQELARRLLVTKGNVCGIVTRLEDLGWVERRADPEDGRANRLHLTAAGKQKIESVLPDHDVEVLRAMHTLSAPNTKALRSHLEELARVSDDGVA